VRAFPASDAQPEPQMRCRPWFLVARGQVYKYMQDKRSIICMPLTLRGVSHSGLISTCAVLLYLTKANKTRFLEKFAALPSTSCDHRDGEEAMSYAGWHGQ
jgi:hypothetical protein